MKDVSLTARHAGWAAWFIAIVVVSTMVAMVFSWRAPGLNLYARDRLLQARGPVIPPDDIVVVAIDEPSIARYGRFPWQRGLTARALDTIASAQPRAIALDVLYSEATIAADDAALAEAIKRAGNAVVAAQLTEITDQSGAPSVRWLRPLPLVEDAAAGIGHANVSTEADGEARELSLRKADDQGQPLWSLAVETIRVGEGVRATSVRDVPSGVILGIRTIPVAPDVPAPHFASRNTSSAVGTLRTDRMAIDYVGPPGSFSHHTFSFADVLDGHVPAQNFRGKYVLIGATAATLGDHVATPFTHTDGAAGEQHGELMPGIEVLANSMNTILRSHFYHETPDWLAALLAALVAAAVLGSLAIAQGQFESVKQVFVLIGLLAIILASAYFAFTRWLIVPPLVPALLSFATAAPLALLRRSLRTSADLDARIRELTSANELLLLSTERPPSSLGSDPATLIAHLTGSEAVSVYLESGRAGGRYRLVASHGTTFAPSLTEDEISLAVSGAQVGTHYSISEGSHLGTRESAETVSAPEYEQDDASRRRRQLSLRLGDDARPRGVLILRHAPEHVRSETVRLCAEIATSYIANVTAETNTGPAALAPSSRWRLPRGVEWKARALGVLNRRLLARARFVDRALRAVEDGLVVADISGRIAFANPRAAEILGIPERALAGSDLFQRLAETEHQGAADDLEVDRVARETLLRLIIGRAPVEREITVGEAPRRYYTLRLSAVTSGDDGGGEILGLVAALSDVTQQHELQEMKSDVMALVTHELLTPLTAIQGMSEVLAEFDVPEERQIEMHLAINDEAKRLSHLITEYMDITKLESGAHPLRLARVRLMPLIERVLLLLSPLAAKRNIRIVRRLAPDLPALLADADLIAQALTNLIANAIKYSPARTEITVEARDEGGGLLVEVSDYGYGISADALPHIFEKFYRVPSVEDTDVPGTGLGLTLVREIVELHGGRVTVHSEAGVGSTFSVRLPLPPKET
jgi:signal transduction histidine kinase/CHASE2 domain-containing sensor protein